VKRRTVTVRFEGEDAQGHGFLFERTIDVSGAGDNPRFYGGEVEGAAMRAASSIRDSVEAQYGRAPGGAG
jgi:hypothetical protein